MTEEDDTHEEEPSESNGAEPGSTEPRVSDPNVTPSRSSGPDAVPFVQRRSGLKWRSIALGAGAAALCTLLGVEVAYIAKSTPPQKAPLASATAAPSESVAVAPSASEVLDAALAEAASPEASSEAFALSSTTPSEDNFVEEPTPKSEKPRHYKTVQDAASSSCSTASVDGLSRQIIEQVRCTTPNAFVPLPPRPNLALDSHIYPYFELSARDHLLHALDTNRQRKMTVHSALRTVAQQYLVWRWSSNRRCGVQMATPPGSSNHETGRALDIADHAQWRPALEAEDFHWLGASDLVHFDYKTSRQLGPAPDVLAFQRLWNRNHPEDKIPESGRYDPPTEQRLKKAPPSGFATGPSCSKKSQKKTASK